MVIIKVGVMELITNQLGMDLEDIGVSDIEQAVHQLIQLCNRLQTENAALRAREAELTKERDELLERNEIAKERVESIISRLKDMEHEG
jgi:cell division protein ZapB